MLAFRAPSVYRRMSKRFRAIQVNEEGLVTFHQSERSLLKEVFRMPINLMSPRKILAAVALTTAFAAAQTDSQSPPKSWIDPDTGHRVLLLTDEPNSASLYF